MGSFTQPKPPGLSALPDNPPLAQRCLAQQLPSEVLVHVFAQLELKDVRAATRVTRAWHVAAESFIWRSINLDADPARELQEEGVLGENSHAIRYTAMAHRWEQRCLSRLETLLAIMDARPTRWTHIRHVHFALSEAASHHVARVIEHTAPSLRTLNIGQQFYQGDRSRYLKVWSDFFRVFEGVQMEGLKKLTMAASDGWHMELPMILRATPQITYLSLIFQYEDPLPITPEAPRMPPLLHLNELYLEITEDVYLALGALLREAPAITWLGLVIYASEPKVFKAVQSAIAASRSLRVLDISVEDDPGIDWWQGMVDTGEDLGDMTDIKHYSSHIAKLVPSLPSLERIYLHDISDALKEIPQLLDIYQHKTCFIRPMFLNQIKAAPRLTEIMFEFWGKISDHLKGYDLSWPEKSILIRSYTSGTDTLYHARLYFKWDANGYDPEFTDDNRPLDFEDDGVDKNVRDVYSKIAPKRFLEGTYFEGHSLPFDVLDKLYKLLDEDIDWEDGGRDMNLPVEAWKMLKGWRRSVAEN